MSQFLGTHHNRLDSKGRVSVPAAFRAQLRAAEDASVVLRPSHKYPCVEAWPATAFAALSVPLDSLDTFSDEHDDLAWTLCGDAASVEPDKEGRIVMPEAMKQFAGLEDAVAFVGMGRRFDIWEPAAAARRAAEARQRTEARRLTLPGRRTLQ